MRGISETIKVLIIVNVLFFVGTMLNQGIAYQLFSLYFFEHPNFRIWQPLTHMFMHGGLWHILFNMYGLWAFGSPLEARWGRSKFLFFYFSAGLGAALIHTLANYYSFNLGMGDFIQTGLSEGQVFELLKSAEEQILSAGRYSINVPNGMDTAHIDGMISSYIGRAVGASGAVYGILVAFAIMFPNIELMLIFLPIPIKAKYFVPLIIMGDLFFGITGSPLGIAHWAHIGGALLGFIMAWYWRKNSFDNTRLY